MIHRISKRIANFLLSKEVIESNEVDIYIYGYEVLFSSIIDFCIILSFGIICKETIEMIVFFAMFTSVRIYTGGYHANTFWVCKIIMISICLLMIISTSIKFSLIRVLFSMTFYNMIVWRFAPVENSNKPLTIEEKAKYRSISIFISLFWSTIAIVTYFSFNKISHSVSMTAIIVAILMILGKNKHRKEEKQYES